MSVTLSTPGRTAAEPREWLGLAVLALGALITSIDVSVVLVALPRIAEDLHASSSEQLWIVDAYGFLLAALLITFGSVADRFGRRRMVMVGAAVFGTASVLAAFAPTAALLILARGLCGVGAAALTPALYGLLSGLFRSDRQRSLAIGVFMGCFMGGMILGPLVGGALLARLPWGAIFLLGVPVMVLLLILCPLLLTESPRIAGRPVDRVSVLLSLLAILPVVDGIKELARTGVQPVPLAAIALGLGMAVVFVRRQRLLGADPQRRPLLDLTMFRSRGFTLVLLSGLLMTLLTGPMMLLNTQYFQLVGGATPFAAGLLTVPAALVSVVGFIAMPLLGRRVRPGIVIGAGLLLVAAALVLMAQVTPQTGPWPLIVGFALVSLGAAPLPTLGTTIIVGSVPLEKASSAASVSETGGQLGYALGIAIVGSLATLVYRLRMPVESGLTGSQDETARESIVGAARVARELPSDLAVRLQAAAADAFCSGIQVTALIAAGVMAALAIICLVRLRHVGIYGA
jgi:DHA2 family multidrug resistance protein-like MFS transporter